MINEGVDISDSSPVTSLLEDTCMSESHREKLMETSLSGCSRFRGQELNTFAYNNKYADLVT